MLQSHRLISQKNNGTLAELKKLHHCYRKRARCSESDTQKIVNFFPAFVLLYRRSKLVCRNRKVVTCCKSTTSISLYQNIGDNQGSVTSSAFRLLKYRQKSSP